MFQRGNNNISPLKYDKCARCVASAAQLSMSMAFSNTNNNLTNKMINSRPKRDFQFQVIEVCQGPKWFIWPSCEKTSKQKQNKKEILKERDNINQNVSPKSSHGYASGSSRPSNHSNINKHNQEITSPTTSNYSKNDYLNNIAIFDKEIQPQDNLNVKNIQPCKTPQSATTTKNSLLTKQTTLQNFSCQKTKFFVTKNTAEQCKNKDVVKNSLVTNYQQNFEDQRQLKNMIMHDDLSNNFFTETSPKTNLVTEVLNKFNRIQKNQKNFAEKKSQEFLVNSNKTGVFEILTVSRKENEDEDSEIQDDDVTNEELYFGDSGYSASNSSVSFSLRKNSRLSSVVEYYSNKGYYTCITGEFLNLNNNNTLNNNDKNKKNALCVVTSKNDNIC